MAIAVTVEKKAAVESPAAHQHTYEKYVTKAIKLTIQPKSASLKSVKASKKTSQKITKLKTKTKYYVKVRTYKTVKVNGKNTKVYSDWQK